MHINYEYIVGQCKQMVKSGKILDYGCGGGDIVQAARDEGLDIVGVEAFLGGGQARELAASRGLLDVHVFPLTEELSIPFPDGTFDLVVSNMVMEHVADLDFTLGEISRVLKPSGKLLTLFPTAGVVREGHCGIPFAHYFAQDSKWRYPYMRIMRGIGFGYFKEGKSQREWVLHFIDWLDKYTAYRSYADIQNTFIRNNFSVEHNETDYMNYRLRGKGINVPLFLRNSTLWKTFTRGCYRLLGGVVILATRDAVR